MAFAGVSLISDGKLVDGYYRTTVDAAAASGYHMLVVEGYFMGSHTQQIMSRPFIVGGHRWCILYYPNGFGKDDAGFISLRLSNQDDGGSPKTAVKARFGFSFVQETEKQDPARIRASRIFEILSSEGCNRFVKMEDLNKSKHFRYYSFTIRCDVVVAEEDVITPLIEVPPSEMKQNFIDLLLAGEGTDVVFQVGGETFAAHRCVLASRSAVFKASLFGPMKEGSTTTAVVQIDDMHPTVFKALLGFIYGDLLPAWVEEDAGLLFQQLLVAADRYGLRRLKAMCEKKLRDHIGVTTTTTVLALAEQHLCYGLKEACYEFLRCPGNLTAVVATDGFDELCRSCPPVMKDMMVAVAVRQAPK